MLTLFRRVLVLFDAQTRRRFALATAGSVFLAFAEVGAVILVMPLMQLILNQPSSNGLLLFLKRLFGFPPVEKLAGYIAMMVFFGFLFKGLASLAIRWWTLGFVNSQGVRTSQQLLSYFLRAPISMHVQRGTADLLRMLNESVSSVYGQVISGGMNIITEAITIVAMSLTLLWFSPLPTIAVVLYFGLAGFSLQRWVKKHSIRAGEALIHNSYVTGQTALQALGGIKEIKLRNEQQVFVDRYGAARMNVAMALRLSSFLDSLPKYALELLFILGVGIMTVMAYVQDPSSGALSTLAIFAVAGFRVLPSTVRLLSSLNLIRTGTPALMLVERDLEAAARTKSTPVADAERLPFTRTVDFNDVHFRYDDGIDDVLAGIDLHLPAGSSLALVGSSGAGKSTMVDVLLGLQQPTSGSITVDGVDIADNIPRWQANLSMVPQEVYLLDSTLADNIRFSPVGEDHNDERLTKVIRQAQLDDLVAELPLGLQTHVGDRGTRLSGGQRQRVGIARALFRDPTLLVLDEATSALDNVTERKITDTIESLHGQITVVVVAHRLSTVRHCDQIAYMENGKIMSIGTFDEVRDRSAGFAKLVELGTLLPPVPAGVVDEQA